MLRKWAEGNFESRAFPPESFPESLNQAALEWCVGGPFYPGIEMTFIAYYRETFLDISNNPSDKPYRYHCIPPSIIDPVERFNSSREIPMCRFCRINHDKYNPGDITAYLALPWQSDFFECNTHWWPVQRPDVV